MPETPETLEPGDLLVATKNDFTVRRDLRTWDELPARVGGIDFVTVTPGLHGMFLGKKPTEERPDGIAIYVPSEASVIVGVPYGWKLLKRVKNKMRQNR